MATLKLFQKRGEMQLREHLTGDEVLMHGRDWIVLKAQKTSERTGTGNGSCKNPRASDPALGALASHWTKSRELAPISPLAAAALLLEVTQRAAALNTMPDGARQ